MSYNSLDAASRDQPLIRRVTASVQQEAHENPTYTDTSFGEQARANPAVGGTTLIWPVALATEAEYESALANNVPNPGGNPSVITDGMILSAVQANWPPDVVVP